MADSMKNKQNDKSQNEGQSDFVMKQLEALAKIVAPCLQCTTCASACPVFQSDRSKNPRLIVHKLCSGDFDKLFKEMEFWWCGGCYSCEAHCPQGVPLTHVLYHLKNLAMKLGLPVPESILRTGRALQTGSIVPLRNEIKARRLKLGLDDAVLPSTEEIESILEATGFFDLMNQSKSSKDE